MRPVLLKQEDPLGEVKVLAALLAAQTGHSHEQAVYPLLEEEGEIRRQMFEEFAELRRRLGEEFDHALELQKYVFEIRAPWEHLAGTCLNTARAYNRASDRAQFPEEASCVQLDRLRPGPAWRC